MKMKKQLSLGLLIAAIVATGSLNACQTSKERQPNIPQTEQVLHQTGQMFDTGISAASSSSWLGTCKQKLSHCASCIKSATEAVGTKLGRIPKKTAIMLIKGTAYQSFSVAMYLIGSNTQIRIMYFQNASEILSNAMIEKDPASIISGAILYTYTGFLVMHPEMQVSIYGHAIPFLQ